MSPRRSDKIRITSHEPNVTPIELQLFRAVWERYQLSRDRQIPGAPTFPSSCLRRKSDSYCTFTTFSDGSTEVQTHFLSEPLDLLVSREALGIPDDELPEHLARKEIHSLAVDNIAEPQLSSDQLNQEDRAAFENEELEEHTVERDSKGPPERSIHRQARVVTRKQSKKAAESKAGTWTGPLPGEHVPGSPDSGLESFNHLSETPEAEILMTSDSPKSPTSETKPSASGVHHRPLVVGLKKPASLSNIMASSNEAAALNKEMEQNVATNTKSAAPTDAAAAESPQPKQKKEKAPKQPKPPKAAPPTAPTSPALIDLRVGHILRAINHPNADSLYVSTIAMGDPEGTDHTQVDEETGKVVRTVCSGLNGLVPLAEMQNRKVIVVANLKPVNMRSIKSAAMVLAASPKQEEGADPHAPDRVVELVTPPEGSEAGDKVYFEGWPYGEGRGPEKTLNPKKKQWEAIQPGFYTGDDLKVGFDSNKCEEVAGIDRGDLIVEGKGACTVKSLKGAVVR